VGGWVGGWGGVSGTWGLLALAPHVPCGLGNWQQVQLAESDTKWAACNSVGGMGMLVGWGGLKNVTEWSCKAGPGPTFATPCPVLRHAVPIWPEPAFQPGRHTGQAGHRNRHPLQPHLFFQLFSMFASPAFQLRPYHAHRLVADLLQVMACTVAQHANQKPHKTFPLAPTTPTHQHMIIARRMLLKTFHVSEVLHQAFMEAQSFTSLLPIVPLFAALFSSFLSSSLLSAFMLLVCLLCLLSLVPQERLHKRI
jgi:hypothetical protein